MEKVMTNGFCELNENEMIMVDGGFDAQQFGKGCLALGGTVIAGAAMMAAAPIVAGAGTTAFVIYGIACIGVSGYDAFKSGYSIGDSFMH